MSEQARRNGVLSDINFSQFFCYSCALLGHVEKECDATDREGAKQFGDWLRASPARRRGSGNYRSKWVESGSSGSELLQRSSDSWGRNFGRNSLMQNTSSWKDSSKSVTELNNDGTNYVKMQGNGLRNGEANRLL